MATKKKKKKGKTLAQQAKELAWAEYAGSISQVEKNKSTNRRQYEEYIPQRQESLGKQIGSDQLATQITGNAIGAYKNEAMEDFKRTAMQNEAARTLRDQTNQASNANALSNYEAQMMARGIDPGTVAKMRANFQAEQGFTSQLDQNSRESVQGSEQRAGRLYDTIKTQNAMQGTAHESNARAQAQLDFNEKFNVYTTTRDQLAGELTKLQKDRGSSYLNTYMTLKKEHEQKQAEAANRRAMMAGQQLDAAVQMGKQASSDFFRQQDYNLKEQKFLNDVQTKVDKGTIDWAKVWLDAKKNGVELPPEWAALASSAGSKSKKTYKYYDPRTGKYTTSTS